VILTVPKYEQRPRPTLGPLVCRFIEENLVHGPGDLRGQPAKLDDEKRMPIWRLYEVWPHKRTDPESGRRVFKRACIMLRKGSAKTEFAAWLALCEVHPDAPVRVMGWKGGLPIGGGVTDAYVPLLANSEEQSGELCFGAVKAILEDCELGRDFDIGLERIVHKSGMGKVLPVANAPGTADGARTTFQVFDETHRLLLPRHKEAHRTMLANVPKRRTADAWSLEITTAPCPGENSVAEDTLQYARQVQAGKVKAPALFFFYRYASDKHKLATEKGLLDAIDEASGPVGEWSDRKTIAAQFSDPTMDEAYNRRVWLNQIARASTRAFDVEQWAKLHRKGYQVPAGAMITLGFDGARTFDSTALIGTEIKTGYQFQVALWERPWDAPEGWEVPVAEVTAAVDDAFRRFKVWRLYADPPYWESQVAEWAGRHGEQSVVVWPTYRTRAMGQAVIAFAGAVEAGELSHDGNADFSRHVGNAYRRTLHVRDDRGERLWTVQKERSDSPNKIDELVAAILSWEARKDAIAAGMGETKVSIYDQRVARGEEVLTRL